jgi:hypothetical protein
MTAIFLKFIISVAGGHFDYLPRGPENLDTAVAYPQNIVLLLCFSSKDCRGQNIFYGFRYDTHLIFTTRFHISVYF